MRNFAIAVAAILALLGCRRGPSADPPREPSVSRASAAPRCVRAGGVCVGPAAIAASPSAPCPPGMRRVDDVTIPDAPSDRSPACYGIPFGEEACCVRE